MIFKFTVAFILVSTLLTSITADKKNEDLKKQSTVERKKDISYQKRGLYGIEQASFLNAPPLPHFASVTTTAPTLIDISSVSSNEKHISSHPEVYIKSSTSLPLITPHENSHISVLPSLSPGPLPPHSLSADHHVKEITVTKEVPVPYLVHVEKKVPYPVYIQVPQPFPVTVEKHVPYEVKVPVEHPVPYAVPKPYPVTVEKHIAVPVEKRVPYPVKVPVDRPYPVHVPVEKPVPYAVEKAVPYPVHIIVDRPVPVPKPYPVTVEKPVPYPVEKHVPYPVKVALPVEKHYDYPDKPQYHYQKYNHYSQYAY